MKSSMAVSAASILVFTSSCLVACAADAPMPDKAAVAAPVSCPGAVPFPNGVEVVKAVRVYKAANGESAFEDVQFKGESKAYFKPGELFSHAVLANAAKVQLVSGPANVVLPYHAPLGKEIFLTIQGSSTIVLPTGQELPVTPGTVVIFDDGGSKTGHAGRTGPCGYVAVNIAFPDSANNP